MMPNLYPNLFLAAKGGSAATPPSLPKSALTEEQVEKKSNAIIEEYLHINDIKVRATLTPVNAGLQETTDGTDQR